MVPDGPEPAVLVSEFAANPITKPMAAYLRAMIVGFPKVENPNLKYGYIAISKMLSFFEEPTRDKMDEFER